MWCWCLTPCRICRRRATAFLDSRHGKPEQTPGAARHRQDREPGAVDRPDVPRPRRRHTECRSVPFPRPRRVDERHLATGRRPGRACRRGTDRPGHRAGGTASRWPRRPATSGCSPTSPCMCAGAATTTIYPTTIADDVAFIVSDSGSRVVFAENADAARQAARQPRQLPDVRRSCVFDGNARRRLGDHPRRARQLGSELLADPRRVDDASTRSSPTSWPRSSTPRARPAGPRACGCGTPPGPTRPPPSTRSTSSATTTCSTCGCRWPTSSARCCSPLPLQIGFPTAIDGRVDKIVDNLAVVRADLHGRRAAHLREGARPHPDDDGRRGRHEEEHLRLGLRRRPRGRRARQAGKNPVRRCSRRSTPSPTGWSSPRSASASVAGCGSSSPARPPLNRDVARVVRRGRHRDRSRATG